MHPIPRTLFFKRQLLVDVAARSWIRFVSNEKPRCRTPVADRYLKASIDTHMRSGEASANVENRICTTHAASGGLSYLTFMVHLTSLFDLDSSASFKPEINPQFRSCDHQRCAEECPQNTRHAVSRDSRSHPRSRGPRQNSANVSVTYPTNISLY
jgi:hypothetical protein